ncbi:hypothetical protein Pcinc_010187 [Petrolisthes cinctipes]|uniref:Uncharacterized protein n=1 Tax=Petrolisthes cinctipes TaxID=88211 RepID=A0AAE1KXM7_PETCI|nr:hypothetical protein Pcinc_010187 [Petrolisthes cinctipes]
MDLWPSTPPPMGSRQSRPRGQTPPPTICPTSSLSSRLPQSLNVNTSSDGQLEAQFLFHPPPANTTWSVGVVVRKHNSDIKEAIVILSHTPGHTEYGDSVIIKCYNTNDTNDVSFWVSPWPDNMTNTAVPRNLKIQVGFSWLALSDNTNGQKPASIRHNCSTDLANFPQVQLEMQCPRNVHHCGHLTICRNECQSRKLLNHPPIPLVLVSIGDGILETEFFLHRPPPNTSWGVYLPITSHQDDSRVAGVVITHLPQEEGQEEMDRLGIWCAMVRDTVTFHDPWHSNTSSLDTQRSIKLQVGSAWLAVTDTTDKHKHITHRYNCSTTHFAHFPHLKLGVRCAEGVNDCGSVSSCKEGEYGVISYSSLH